MEANLALPAALIGDPVRPAILSAMRRTSATGCCLGLRRACLAAMRQQLSSADRGERSIFPRRFSSKTAFYGAPFP
jgi:hypothetical protein